MTDLDDPQLLARLVELSVTVNSTLEPDQLLRAILTAATELLACETASILLYNPTRGDLSFMSATDAQAAQMAEIPVPLDGSLAGWFPFTVESSANGDPGTVSPISL